MFYFYPGFDPKMLALSNFVRDAGLQRISELVAAHYAISYTGNPPAAVRECAIEIQGTITGFVIGADQNNSVDINRVLKWRCLGIGNID